MTRKALYSGSFIEPLTSPKFVRMKILINGSALILLLNGIQAVTYDTTCNSGYYLKNDKVCTPCSPGYYCIGGTTNYMAKCKSGYYSKFGDSSCTQCPAGYSCSDSSQPPIACPEFEYSIAGSTSCAPCPVGSVCPNGIISQCQPGEQCSSKVNVVKLPCPAGYQCPTPYVEELSDSMLCPLGTYSLQNSVSCTKCPIGSICPSPSLPPVACPSGFYQDLPGQTTCNNCPKGYYCNSAVSFSPVRCELGQFSPDNAAACIDCPAGYMCGDQEIDAPVLCPKGFYSSAKSSFCMTCPEGYSCLDRKSITKCASGYYSLNGMDSCLQCPIGYECGSLGSPMPCGAGQYALPGAISCTFCPIGNYCPSALNQPIPCTIGQYQDEIGQSLCKVCPPGYTCIDPSLAPVACASGQFTDRFNQQCYVCPAGYDCSSKRYDDLKQCPRGTYSLSGESLCKPCPAGYYCPKPDQDKISCPSGTYAIEGQTSCTQCPVGYRCLDKKGKYMVRCLAGQYISSSTGQCTDCPAGYACPNPESGFDNMVQCIAGTYSGPGQSYCTVCPPGKYCPVTNQIQELDCPAGQVSFGGATACVNCPKNHECPTANTQVPCPIYFYSPEGTGVCLRCPDGMQCNNPKIVNPEACPAGYYIQTLDWKCQPCPYGHSCPSTPTPATTPIICKKHEYQDTMASQTCKQCPDGYFSGRGFEYCQPIPAGFERDISSNEDLFLSPCPEGKYSDWGFKECKTCENGFLCPKGGELGVHYGCPKGSYCIEGVQYKCKPGQYGLIDRARNENEGCEVCPAGYYCLEGTSAFDLHPCPRGSYCPVETGVPFNCPKGTYNDELYGRSINDCKLCPMGHECDEGTKDQGTPCAMGYFCPLGSYPNQFPCPPGTYSGLRTSLKDQSECIPCPSGHYCPSGTDYPLAVEPGYYQPHQGIGDEAAKVICPGGYHCPIAGLVTYFGYHCSPGYYCPAGSTSPKEVACPEGTYSDSHEIFDSVQCLICPGGYKCALATSSSANMTDCPRNEYCPPGTKSSQTLKCPAGSYAPYLNSKSLDDCIPCPYGQYCLSGEDPVDCPMGYYCPKSTKFAHQYPCPAGFYLDKLAGKVLGECIPCQIGNYCPEASPLPIACPPGTFNDFSNTADKCLDCPPGRYCPKEGTKFPPKCQPGKYSDSKALKCSFCEVGTYCPNEATTKDEKNEQRCPAGVFCMIELINYSDTDPTTDLVATVNGKFGLDVYPNLRDHYCSEGYYCPLGTTSMLECPAGTYNRLRGRKTIMDCQRVEPGYYTSIAAQSAIEGPCSAGFYCPEGSTSPEQVPCPAGTFRSIDQGGKPEDCAICTSGFYCPQSGMAAPTLCPQGFYCPLGTKYPEPCPEGTYGAAEGLTDSYSCTKCPSGKYCGKKNLTAPQDDCDEGYYCIKGSKRPEPTDKITGAICPAGGYCEKGASAPSNCIDGEFNNFEGGESSDDCQPCWPGYFCKGQSILVQCPAGKYCELGTSDPSLIADAGYYAPLGSDQKFKCPRGTYNSQLEQATCKQCEAGYFCGDQQMTAPIDCPAGYYCPSYQTFKDSNTYYDKLKCPIGTYSSQTNLKSSSQCTPCPKGKYCDKDGLTSYTGNCLAGYFCKKYATVKDPQVLNVNNYFGPCPAGSYCPQDVEDPVKCPIGTFSTQTLATNNSVCVPCTEGYYCGTTGLTAPTAKCAAGYYCPEGSATSKGGTSSDLTLIKECDIQYYCPLGSPAPVLCPPGFYQELKAQGKCNLCPKGYYCIDGKRTICPEGYVCF